MSPVPNFLAGIAIALAATTWGALVVACLAWAFAACGFVWIKEGRAERVAISYYQGHGERLFGSPAFTFYAIEWTTALIIALMIAIAPFAIRRMFF
jgi:hypothetical protein